jgi:hypothetical protein
MRRDRKWWLPPLSYSYVGPRQTVATRLLQQQTVPDTSPVIGLAQADPLPAYEVPSYQPVTAPFAPA